MSNSRTGRADPGAEVSGGPEAVPFESGLVRVVDTPEDRVRHPRALVWMIACALGTAGVMFLSVVAHGTTAGVTEDVRSFNDLLAAILFVPVAVLQGLVILFAPVAVMIELGVRRLGRQIVESIAAGVLGLLIGVLTTFLVRHLGSDELVRGMSVWERGTGYVLTIPEFAVALTAMLTVAGPATRRRTVRISWNLMFLALLIVLITGQVSLPGTLVALLLGRLAGSTVQYVSGIRSERAYGADLVTAVRRAGFAPISLARVRALSDGGQGVDQDGATAPVLASALAVEHGVPDDAAALALGRAGDNRVYALYSDDGVRRDVLVLDGDRQVVGLITRLWRALRLRGIEGRAAISLKAVAERTALLSYAATAAGVRTPRLLGIGEFGDSIALVLEHATQSVSLRDVPDEDVHDDVLAEAWDQLGRAHAVGLTHRALTQDVLLTQRDHDGRAHVWITGWEQGDIASSPLSRRLDLVQMLALTGLRVGPRRAVAAAVRALPDADIAAIGPLIQTIALPRTTREEVRRAKGLMGELRNALVERLPEASVQPQRISRFSARTVLTTTVAIVAVAVIVTTINFDEIAEAVRSANPWWVAVAFALALITWFGAGLTLVAFSPARVPIGRATLTAAAGSFVALAAPAGIGPAALNLRLLTQRGVSMSMAVATVALVQVSQFVVTVLLLVALSVFTGSGALVELPSPAVLITLAGIATAVVATLLVPPVRRWGMGFIGPRLRQVWPRLAQMLSHPGRLALGVGGNLIMTLGYIVGLWCCLAAFGETLSLVDIALVNLVGNALGALIPTPGGLGGVEGALTAGLTAAGVPATIAFSATILYRLCTYWGRVPLGWVAMRYLERKGDL
ncbi:lysylphosphatidylglycerol synthase transmembrane domain-containing protein [Promicromonospora sukumoe]|uniref:lysylphosphatidylglycerol synthase transmembrane domain-containing protein n=1 Tax=Promicromonospora sukumoe TaxID=88382 RepID=UPI000A010018|nr:lysylphosphatidylglycerol synthase transmembrane domain-containing protein [Promicromonospora sukumoe]